MENETSRAWIVPVWIERLGGGPLLACCYVAGFADPSEAKAAVERSMVALEGDDIRDPAPMSNGTAEALRVMPRRCVAAMTRLPKHPRDTNQLAKAIVDLATGEPAEPTKTQVRATKAGVKGSPARAKALTTAQRSEIASIAASAAGRRLRRRLRRPHRRALTSRSAKFRHVVCEVSKEVKLGFFRKDRIYPLYVAHTPVNRVRNSWTPPITSRFRHGCDSLGSVGGGRCGDRRDFSTSMSG